MSHPPQQPDPNDPRHGDPQQGPPPQWWYPGQQPHGAQQGYPSQPQQGQFGAAPYYWAQQAYPGQQQWGQQQWGGAPPPKRKRTGLIVTLVALGAVLLAGVGVATWFFAFQGDDIVAGDCFGTDEVAVDAEIYEAECGSAESGFRVVKVVEDGAVDRCAGSFVEQERGRVLCNTLDVRADDCLMTGGNPKAIPIKVDCADPSAQLVVNSVQRSEPGPGTCPDGELPLGTRTPPLTACLTQLRAS